MDVAHKAAGADGRADFDFEVGHWQVQSRRLKAQLQGSTDWEEFVGIAEARKVLGGLGIIDEITNERPSGPTQGMTLRLFDPQTQQWTIYFAGNVQEVLVGLLQGVFTPPLIGGFTVGRGVFYGHEFVDGGPSGGKHIFTRYLWVDITPTTYRWEQAFSADGGGAWETNWIQEHSRLQP
jgi:Protein of unknown function (DUF1579)